MTEATVLDDAYAMGYDRFEGTDTTLDREGGVLPEADVSHFQESAQWANNVAPKLRAMAGYDDAGYGTYQQDRKVALVRIGDDGDEPAEAGVLAAHDVATDVMDQWRRGARDALCGRERDPAPDLFA